MDQTSTGDSDASNVWTTRSSRELTLPRLENTTLDLWVMSTVSADNAYATRERHYRRLDQLHRDYTEIAKRQAALLAQCAQTVGLVPLELVAVTREGMHKFVELAQIHDVWCARRGPHSTTEQREAWRMIGADVARVLDGLGQISRLIPQKRAQSPEQTAPNLQQASLFPDLAPPQRHSELTVSPAPAQVPAPARHPRGSLQAAPPGPFPGLPGPGVRSKL